MVSRNENQNILTSGPLIPCAKDIRVNRFPYIPKSKLRPGKETNRITRRTVIRRNGYGTVGNVRVDTHEEKEPCPLLHAILTYFGYAVLVLVGYINDIVRPRISKEKHREVRLTTS